VWKSYPEGQPQRNHENQKVKAMDDIRIGDEVYCENGRVGEVARLIADASDSHISDLVVDRGLLHGAKVIPLGEVSGVSGNRVDLAMNHQQFLAANGFANPHFREPHDGWSVPRGYDSAASFMVDAQLDVGSAAGYGDFAGPVDFPPSPADPRPNSLRPSIKEGTAVRSSNGHKVGEIGQVSFHPDDGRLDAISLKRGLFGHEHLSLPLEWIEGFDDEGLVLRVSTEQVEQLGQKPAQPS
jgi:uncharacterized protein YrrD